MERLAVATAATGRVQTSAAAATGRHWRHHGQREAVTLGVALAENLEPGDSLRGFVAMEKYDGFRATWEVASATPHFRTRHGKELHPPKAMAALLPVDVRLDGELW